MAQVADIWEKDDMLHPDAHMFFNLACVENPEVMAMTMTQLSMNAGRKEWGARADAAIHAEVKQLHMRDTFEPLHWKDLDDEEKSQVLRAHLFLKLKRDGTLKARSVAGGNKQRDFVSKEDASLPTASMEAVLYTGIIEAREGRNMISFDVPNAFITTRVLQKKHKAILLYDGHLVDVLIAIDPEFKKYLRIVRQEVFDCPLQQCHLRNDDGKSALLPEVRGISAT